MPRWIPTCASRNELPVGTAILALAMAVIPAQRAVALITGGEGNKPITDPGWPKGAAAIFNNKARIAWWEGPPFGGGQWHAECRGDAKALSAVLADFTGLNVKTKRVIVHDGIGHSFWLNPNHEPAKEAAARMDWMFMVWQPASWERLRKLPGDLDPTDARDADTGPPAQIDVYTGGNLRWSDVAVPEGLEVSRRATGSPRIHVRGRPGARKVRSSILRRKSPSPRECNCSASSPTRRVDITTRSWPRPPQTRTVAGS